MKPTDKLRVAMRWIIAVWFLTLNLFILIPSAWILARPDAKQVERLDAIDPPTPPAPPILMPLDLQASAESQKEQVSNITNQVGAYTQQVNLYTQQVNAYKAQLDSAAKSDRSARYKSVVTDSLVPIFNASIVTFLGWVFANVAAGASERFTELRGREKGVVSPASGESLTSISLL